MKFGGELVLFSRRNRHYGAQIPVWDALRGALRLARCTANEPYLNGRQIVLPQGKIIGRRSAIDGKICFPRKSAKLRSMALDGVQMGYSDVLHFFLRLNTIGAKAMKSTAATGGLTSQLLEAAQSRSAGRSSTASMPPPAKAASLADPCLLIDRKRVR
jgi:hypothetical protein